MGRPWSTGLAVPAHTEELPSARWYRRSLCWRMDVAYTAWGFRHDLARASTPEPLRRWPACATFRGFRRRHRSVIVIMNSGGLPKAGRQRPPTRCGTFCGPAVCALSGSEVVSPSTACRHPCEAIRSDPVPDVCPQCGSGDLLDEGQGWLRCQAPVIVGLQPTGAPPGLGVAPVPVYGECGVTFRSPAWLARRRLLLQDP